MAGPDAGRGLGFAPSRRMPFLEPERALAASIVAAGRRESLDTEFVLWRNGIDPADYRHVSRDCMSVSWIG